NFFYRAQKYSPSEEALKAFFTPSIIRIHPQQLPQFITTHSHNQNQIKQKIAELIENINEIPRWEVYNKGIKEADETILSHFTRKASAISLKGLMKTNHDDSIE